MFTASRDANGTMNGDGEEPAYGQLIVVSNRLPFVLKKKGQSPIWERKAR
jgi:hypothetical protein